MRRRGKSGRGNSPAGERHGGGDGADRPGPYAVSHPHSRPGQRAGADAVPGPARHPQQDGNGHGRPAVGGNRPLHVTNPSPYGHEPALAYDGPTGIRVSGTGTATGVPDVAVISLGVEVHEDTAAEARAKAARAMDEVMTALTQAGVSPEDIRTSRFSVAPRYQGVEVRTVRGR